jgi:hypothetical protein
MILLVGKLKCVLYHMKLGLATLHHPISLPVFAISKVTSTSRTEEEYFSLRYRSSRIKLAGTSFLRPGGVGLHSARRMTSGTRIILELLEALAGIA